MCWDCFKRYAEAPVVNERVMAAYRLIKDAPGDPSFGLNHIHVGDMNLDDCHFDIAKPWLRQAYAEAEPWERAIFDALKALSEEERATAVAMEWGYISPSGELREDLR